MELEESPQDIVQKINVNKLNAKRPPKDNCTCDKHPEKRMRQYN